MASSESSAVPVPRYEMRSKPSPLGKIIDQIRAAQG
jgi:hypothetical protein